MVTKELLIELKEILREDYGLSLSDQKVSEIGNSLVNVFQILLNENGDENEKRKES